MNTTENESKIKKEKERRLLALCILAALLILCGVCFGIYSPADGTAQKALRGNREVPMHRFC